MLRLFFLLSLITSANVCLANEVSEYRQTKNGITLITVYGDDSERKILDAFLKRLAKKLKRPSHLQIMIIVDSHSQVPWSAVMGYDSLRFDVDFIDDTLNPVPRDPAVEFFLDKNRPINTEHKPVKKVEISWNTSYHREKKDVGLKILYTWSESDSNSIFFDRIYSLAKYGVEHLEEIKKTQKKMIVKYYLVWVDFWALTMDTSEIKKIPLQSLGFDPNNIQTEAKSNWTIWVISSIVLVMLILFFIFKKRR